MIETSARPWYATVHIFTRSRCISKHYQMNYLNSRLTRPVRIGIMIFWIGLFLILSPIIILYTAGYRFDVFTRQVKQTGVLSIDIEPRDANVYVNGIKMTKRLPMRLSNLTPGSYIVRFESPGYHEWEKSIVTRSNQTVYIRDLILFKKTLPTLQLSANRDNVVDLTFSSTGKYALLTKKLDNSSFEIILHNLRTEADTVVARIAQETQPIIRWSPFDDHALIYTSQGSKAQMYMLNASQPQEQDVYRMKSFPKRIQWKSEDNAPVLYIETETDIRELSSNQQRIVTTTPQGNAWFIDQEGSLFIQNQKNRTLSQYEKGSFRTISTPTLFESIIDANQDRIIAKTQDGRTALFHVSEDAIEHNTTLSANFARYHATTQQWMLWSPWELFAINATGESALINRTSEPVIDIFSLDQNGLLLLQHDKKITGFNPGFLQEQVLLDSINIQSIGIDPGNRSMHIWGTIGKRDGVYRLEY
jgi:hypothetical protein